MAERLRRHTYAKEVQTKFNWTRFLFFVVALVGMTSVIPWQGMAQTAKNSELQVRFAHYRDVAVDGWQTFLEVQADWKLRFQDARADWSTRCQLLKVAAQDTWRAFRSHASEQAEDLRLQWHRRFGMRESELADVEEMSLLLDKPLAVYVAPKEQWNSFWKGVEPYRLRWKLAQVLVVIPWFLLVGALAHRDHVAYRAAVYVNRLIYDPAGANLYRALVPPLDRHDEEILEGFADFWQAVEG